MVDVQTKSTADISRKFKEITGICLESKDEWDFCRRIVYSDIFDHAIQGCALAYVNNLGNLEYGAKFGQVDSSNLGSSIWDGGVVSEALRGLEPKASCEDAKKSIENCVLVLPLHHSKTPIGALIVFGQRDFSYVENEVLAVLGNLVGFVVKLGFGGQKSRESGVQMIDAPEPLSSRQIRILELIAEKYINADIARELMMSESTIRQETVRIYRALGVSDRAAAVKRGVEFGFLKVKPE